MEIHFATCERDRALHHLRVVLASGVVDDAMDSAGPFLDLVEADLVRVQDPMMHGNRIAIIPGTKWDEARRQEVMRALMLFAKEDGSPRTMKPETPVVADSAAQ